MDIDGFHHIRPPFYDARYTRHGCTVHRDHAPKLLLMIHPINRRQRHPLHGLYRWAGQAPSHSGRVTRTRRGSHHLLRQVRKEADVRQGDDLQALWRAPSSGVDLVRRR